MNSASINQALKDCPTLEAALRMLTSLGIASGILRVFSANARGWIVFRDKKVTGAVFADTTQIGQDAFMSLVKLQDVTCTYIAESGSPPTTQRAAPTIAAKPAGLAISTESQSEMTQRISGESDERPAVGTQSHFLTEQELRESIFGRDRVPDFLEQDRRLDYNDAPLRRNVHYRRRGEGEQTDSISSVLAATGFVSDFRDAAPPPDPWRNFHGDPANQEVATVSRPARGRSFSKYWKPAGFVALCASIYFAPALIWNRAESDIQGDLKSRQATLVNSTVQDTIAEPVEHPFDLPAGQTSSPAGPSQGTNGNVSPTLESVAAAPADQPSLADVNSPEKLMALVCRYMAHGDLKEARELAAVGMRLYKTTPAERQSLIALYNQCLSISSKPNWRPYRKPLSVAQLAKAQAMVKDRFSIYPTRRPDTDHTPQKDRASSRPEKKK